MIRIHCDRADAILKETQTLTTGMATYPTVQITFEEDWEGLSKIVVIRAGTITHSIALLEDSFIVPYDCFETAGVNLIIGVYGSNATTGVVIPTVWCAVGEIFDGTDYTASDNIGEPTPSLVSQMMDYAEAARDAAQASASYAIHSVQVDDSNANYYGTASVELTDSGAGENRTLTFEFANLKGRSIDTFLVGNDGTIQVRLEGENAVTTYTCLKDALTNLSSVISTEQAAEAERILAENERVSAEADRVQAELAREEEYAAAMAQIEHIIETLPNVVVCHTTAEWDEQTTYVPNSGEVIVYTDHDTKVVDGQTVNIPGVKIGDGSAYVVDLPFIDEAVSGGLLDHIQNTSIHVTASEKEFWNNKLNCVITNENLVLNRL